jgi:hypothetical protein
MVPDLILPVAELPRGSRGKADYEAVLELVQSQRDHLGRLQHSESGTG